jgi:glycosyltransferase involved in cell wall biosynthesis
VFSAMERIAARWTDRLFVINEEDRRAAVGMGGLQPEQIVWTPGIGVDLDVYQRIGSGEERVKRELGIESSRQYIIVVGEFIERKRHADFLRAFAKAQLADVDAVFAGRGRLEKRLRKLTAELGLEAKVHFAGYRSDIPRLVSTAVLLCLPSDQEGLPRCVLEAMAIGVPVVGTDIRGTRDLLGDGCGKLVPVGEVDMLALALREVCEDRDVASKLVAAASQRVKDFELRKVTCIYDRVYGVEGVDEVLG